MASGYGGREAPSSKKKKPGQGKQSELMAMATASIASMVAAPALERPLGPDLSRQPKTMNAMGITSILKQKTQDTTRDRDSTTTPTQFSTDFLKPSKSMSSEGSDMDYRRKSSFRRKSNRSDDQGKSNNRRSTIGEKLGGKRSSSAGSIDRQRLSATSQTLKESTSPTHSPKEGRSESTSLDKMVVEDEDNWDMFIADEAPDYDDTELLEQEPQFEMAIVEIDVNEALEEMDLNLKKALSQARLTDREKTVLSDKFGLILQALVSYQESEVEIIDNLRMKSNIMEVLNVFIAAQVEVGSNRIPPEEGTPEEPTAPEPPPEQVQAPTDALPDEEVKPAEAGGGEEERKAGHKDSQGISIDEMAATTVRETLLMQKNKLEMQESMRMVHLLELKQLEFERTLLAIHYSRMVKPSDLIRQMKDLRKNVNDLKLELATIQNEIAQLQLDIGAEEKGLKDDEVVVDKWDLDVLTKQMDVQQGANRPLHLAREADKEAHRLEQLQDAVDSLGVNLVDGYENARVLQAELDITMAELNVLLKEESRMQQHRKLSLHEAETLLADLENMNRREQSLLDRNAACTEKLANCVKARKQLYEDLHHTRNDANKSLREYQKLERTIRLAHDAHINAKMAYDKMRSAFEATRPKDDSNNWEKLTKMFLREIANLKNALNKKLDEAAIKASQVDKLQKKLNELYEDQINCGKELQELIRTTVRKRREREEKSEQCIKLESQIFKVLADKKMQLLVLDDCARTERDLARATEVVREKYNKIKIERASVMNDLIAARQKVTEQTEKLKICHNEIESYNNQCFERERELQRTHYLNLNAGLARDSVRNEAHRSVQKYRFYHIERDELQLCNRTLRKEIARQRVEVGEIRGRFEKAIHDSNKCAIVVRERTEEVCTFIERIKSYEMILLRGQLNLTTREIEKTKLLEVLDIVRKHLLHVQVNRPDEGGTFRKIEVLRKRFMQVTRERRALEEEMNNVYDKNRVREIHHNWIEDRETVPQLRKKVEHLEQLLATRDCRILERDLTVKQIEFLTEGSIERACWLKKRYENDIKDLVSIRKNLYHLSAKIDGMICETSVAFSKAESTEAEYNELKKKCEIAELRFEMCLPPNADMESAWNHNYWQQTMLTRARNRPPGFYKTINRPKGAAVVMERLRPKKKAEEQSFYRYQSLPQMIHPQPKLCPPRPYVRSHKPLKNSKTDILRQKTGLVVCDVWMK